MNNHNGRLGAHLIVGALLLFAQGCCGAQFCGRGHYFKAGADGKEGDCLRCQPGFYMDEQEHRNEQCKKCFHFDMYAYMNKEQTDECTIYHDTQWRCVKGHFMKADKNCYPCTQCELKEKYEVQACTQLSDTVCCDFQEMIAVDGKCVAPTQHTATIQESTSSTCQTCKPCPEVPKEAQFCEKVGEKESQQSCDGVCWTKEKLIYVLAGVVFAFVAGIVSKRCLDIFR